MDTDQYSSAVSQPGGRPGVPLAVVWSMLYIYCNREALLCCGCENASRARGEEEATNTPVEKNPVIHFHSPRELVCQMSIGSSCVFQEASFVLKVAHSILKKEQKVLLLGSITGIEQAKTCGDRTKK